MKGIRGLDLRAKNSRGDEVQVFNVRFIHFPDTGRDLAIGVENENSTAKNFLELYVAKEDGGD